MKLLTSPTTPFGRICRIIIAVHGLDVEEVPVKIWVERDKVEGLNPLSKIPVLLLDDGTPIVDSRVIADYLDTLGDHKLQPNDRAERLRMRSDCAIWHEVATTAAAVFAPAGMLDSPLPQKVIDWQLGKISASLRHMEDLLPNPGFDPAAPLSMVHIYAVSALGMLDFRLSDLVPWRSEFPKLADWCDGMHENHEAIEETEPQA